MYFCECFQHMAFPLESLLGFREDVGRVHVSLPQVPADLHKPGKPGKKERVISEIYEKLNQTM